MKQLRGGLPIVRLPGVHKNRDTDAGDGVIERFGYPAYGHSVVANSACTDGHFVGSRFKLHSGDFLTRAKGLIESTTPESRATPHRPRFLLALGGLARGPPQQPDAGLRFPVERAERSGFHTPLGKRPGDIRDRKDARKTPSPHTAYETEVSTEHSERGAGQWAVGSRHVAHSAGADDFQSRTPH